MDGEQGRALVHNFQNGSPKDHPIRICFQLDQ